MTIFDQNSGSSRESVAPETPEAILAQVTEKFKNDKGELDVVALAKGKIEADNFIERLKSEQDGLRQDLNSRAALEELIEDLKTARQSASNPQSQAGANESGQEQPKNETALTLEAVKNLLKEELTQTQKQALAQRNVDFAEAELTKQWGNQTKSKLEAKARELDVSLDFLKSIAATKPRAFLEMVGARVTQAVNTHEITPPPSRQNAPVKTGTGERDYSYYQKLRKDNPTLYWSSQVQMQEMKDAQRLGEAFYSKG